MDGTKVYNDYGLKDLCPTIKRIANSDPFNVKQRLLENISSLPTGISIFEVRGNAPYENTRVVIIVNKTYDTIFSFISTQTNSTPSMQTGLYSNGVWYT